MKSVVFKSVSGSPDSAEWHAWRAQGIGGSDAPVIALEAGLIDASKKPEWMKSIHDLYLIKTGQVIEASSSGNWAIQRGKHYEKPARKRFVEKTGIAMLPGFGQMDEFDFVRASFDGLPFSSDALLEIKVPGREVHELAKYGRVVDYYRPQIAHQAMTAWGHPDAWQDQITYFASYNPENGELAIVEVPAKDYRQLAVSLLAAEKKFWVSVEQSAPPCGQEWLEKAARYVQANEALEQAKAKADLLKQELIDMLGTGKILQGGGVSATRSIRKGSVDYTKLLQDIFPSRSEEELTQLCNKYRKEDSVSVIVKCSKNAAFDALS